MLYSKIFWKVQSGFPVGKNAFYLTLWNMNYHQDGKDGGNQDGKIGGEQGVDWENRKTLIIEVIKEDSEISTVSIEFVAGKDRRGS